MLTFHDMLPELHGVIRDMLGIRARMQLRQVSRMFHAWDKDLIAPAHLLPPAPLAVLKYPSISGHIIEWMQPEHKGFCDLVQSLGGGRKIMTVAAFDISSNPWSLQIDMRRPSNVEGEADKFDSITHGTHWRYNRHGMYNFSSIWKMILTERLYTRWNRGAYAWSEHEYGSMIK